LTLVLEFIFEFRDSGLSLLDLALELGNEGLFVLELAAGGVKFRLLLLEVVLEIVALTASLFDALL